MLNIINIILEETILSNENAADDFWKLIGFKDDKTIAAERVHKIIERVMKEKRR